MEREGVTKGEGRQRERQKEGGRGENASVTIKDLKGRIAQGGMTQSNAPPPLKQNAWAIMRDSFLQYIEIIRNVCDVAQCVCVRVYIV